MLVNLMSSYKYCSTRLSPGFNWSTLYSGCFLFPCSFAVQHSFLLPMGWRWSVSLGISWRSLWCTPKGAHKQKASLALGLLSCTCRAFTPGSKQKEGQVVLEQHAPLPAAGSPTLSHSCSECQQHCLNKQVAYFSINMQKASFNVQRLKQQHCQGLILQSFAFVTDKLLKLGESISFLPVSPYSICQALIFFSLLPAELEINNFYFFLSLVCHQY